MECRALLDPRRLSGAEDPLSTWLRLPGMLCTADVFAPMDPWLELPGATLDVDIRATTVEDAARELLDVAAGQPEPVGVIGLSLGAIVTMAAAVLDPTSFAAIVVMSTNALAPRVDQRDQWERQSSRTTDGEFDAVVAETLPLLFASNEQLERHRDCAVAMARATGPLTFRRQLALQQSRQDLVETLPAVTVPALVLAGGADRLCPVERHREIAAALPRATLTTFESAGHLMTLECPQTTASAVNAWASSVGIAA